VATRADEQQAGLIHILDAFKVQVSVTLPAASPASTMPQSQTVAKLQRATSSMSNVREDGVRDECACATCRHDKGWLGQRIMGLLGKSRAAASGTAYKV
jgi:hypothetical protein